MIEDITPSFIEELFKSWRRGNFSQEALGILSFWTTETQSIEQKKLSIRDNLFHIVQSKVAPNFIEAITTKDEAVILHALQTIFKSSISDEQVCTLLYCRYLSARKFTVKELSSAAGVSSRTLRRYVLSGFERVAMSIKQNQMNSQTQKEASVSPAIQTKIGQLIGIKPSLEKITRWLYAKDAPYFISIEGLGGIGKTALAELLKTQTDKGDVFKEVFWVSARQNKTPAKHENKLELEFTSTFDDVISRLANEMGQTHLAGQKTSEKLAALKKITHSKKTLIFIDNLETIEDIQDLIPALISLTNPSKVVVTSRKNIHRFDTVYTFPVPELSFTDSQNLIRKELARRGKNMTVDESTLRSLYEVTGGIPLALKLASAQFGFYSTEEIIQQFRNGKKDTQNLYTHIYRQAWLLLSNTAKKLLLSMLLVSPDGEERDWICQVSNFSVDEFNTGLKELKHLSLVEFSGSINKPLHRIHRLTATFLQTDILNLW